MWKTTRACTPPDKTRFTSTTSSLSTSTSLKISPSCPFLCQKQSILPSQQQWSMPLQQSDKALQLEEEEEEEEEIVTQGEVYIATIQQNQQKQALQQPKQNQKQMQHNKFFSHNYLQHQEDAMAGVAANGEDSSQLNYDCTNRDNHAIQTASNDNRAVLCQGIRHQPFTANHIKGNTTFLPCNNLADNMLNQCQQSLNNCNNQKQKSCYQSERLLHSSCQQWQKKDNISMTKQQFLKYWQREYQLQQQGKQQQQQHQQRLGVKWNSKCIQEEQVHSTRNRLSLNGQWNNTAKSPFIEYVLHRQPPQVSQNASNERDDTTMVYQTPYLQRTQTHCFEQQITNMPPALVPSLLYTPQVDPERLSLRVALDHELDLINEAYKYTMLDPITTLIEDELYIGGFPDENTLTQLRSKKINNVINCCSCDYVSDADFKRQFNVIQLACYDRDDYLILHTDYDLFRQVLSQLIEQRHQRVFVHCIAGVNRSVTLCAAYLIDRLHITPIDAIRLFRAHGRMHILDNNYFRHQLVDHYLQSLETANLRISTRLSL